MNVDDLKPLLVGRFGGMVDYQDPTKVINGCALLAQMVRFGPDQVGTCFGTVNTMMRQQPYEEVTGINVLDVLGVLNPGQVPILFGDQGSLLQESPAGSGALVELDPPFPLPAGAYMRCADAENTTTMVFSDGTAGLVPPLRYNGVGQLLSTPQNVIGALWSKDVIYQVGDLVRSPDGRFWRCTTSANTFGSAAGPQWPALNGYFTNGTAGSLPSPGVWNPATAVDGNPAINTTLTNAVLQSDVGTEFAAEAASYVGMTRGTQLLIDTGENQETVTILQLTGQILDHQFVTINFEAVFQKPHVQGVPILSVNTNGGGSEWEEWTPACVQYLPAPDVSGMSVVHNPGQGTIPAGKDVYIKVCYNGAAIGQGISPRSSAVVFQNTSANDELILGQTGAAGVLATDGGFNMPRWLAEIFLNPLFFTGSASLIGFRVFAAAVAHGAAAPPDSAYTDALIGAGFALPCQTITIRAIEATLAPVSTNCAVPYFGPNAPFGLYSVTLETAIGGYIGEFGQRFMIVTRYNQNGSLAPVDPNSPVGCNFIGQLQLPLVSIVRDALGNVTATVGDVTIGWAKGQKITIGGCTGDATFNGAFTITNVQATLNPQGIITWSDPNNLTASNDTTGTITLPAGPIPVAFLPPGGPNDLEDIAAFTTANPPASVNGSQAGPYFYVSQATPLTPYTTPILAMAGAAVLDFDGLTLTRDAGGFVTTTVPDIAGIATGNLITVSESTDPSFDGQWTLQGVTPGVGTAGELTWEQFDDTASTATANLAIQIGEQSSVQITVQDASGFQAGNVCLANTGVLETTGIPTPFDGPVTIASIVGNVLTVSSLATGQATIHAPYASLTLLQNLPTCAAAAKQTIMGITRDAKGNVQCSVGNALGWAAGMPVKVVNVPTATFNGSFPILGVRINQDGVTGTLSWSQPGQVAAADLSGAGTASSSSDIAINYQDELLTAEADNEVTDQLNMSPPPPAADVYFVPSLQKYCYTRGNDSIFLFSETGDAENIDLGDGSLSVDDNSMSLSICVREARTGEIIALKADSGYAVNPSDLPPTEWPCPTRWNQHGPPCAAAVGKGKDFLIFPSFWSDAGCWLYIDGKLDWLTKEFQKIWDRVNKAALNTIWTIVDEQEKEVQIGLPLDGAATPSHIVVGSYIEGWGPQEVLNRYGKLITARSAVRWSIRPRAVRAAAVVQRALAAPVPGLSVPYPIATISRVGGLATIQYGANLVPPVGVGDTLQILDTSDGSFIGVKFITAVGPTTLSYVQNTVGHPAPITNWLWIGGLSGEGTGTLMMPGEIPVGVAPGISLYFRGTGSELDGQAFVATTVVQGVPLGGAEPPFYLVTFGLGGAFTQDTGNGQGGLCQFFYPPPDPAQPSQLGFSYLSTLVPNPTTDPRVQTRQVLLAPSGPNLFDSVSIVSADRRTGIGPNAALGTVVTFRFNGPLDGDLTDVIVSGMSDPSFDGEYTEPTAAPWGQDGKHTILQFTVPGGGPTGVAFGGQIQSTLPCLRVVMQDPTRLDDNGVALDSRYTPALAQGGNLMVMRWGAFNIQVLALLESDWDQSVAPTITLTPKFEAWFGTQDDPSYQDPDATFPPVVLPLKRHKPTRVQDGLRVPDNEYLTIEVSNGKVAGQGFILQDLTFYGNPIFTGRRA